MSYKIGIDISGGDFAPHESFKGAVLANKELAQKIVLIGIEEEIEREAEKEKIDLENFEVIDAPEKISMDEVGAMSIRRKRKSSIAIGLNLLKERKIDAFVSCGNTAAVVSAASLILGVIEGAERPGISVLIPTAKDISLVIDVGANINPKPLHLLQYGIMASLYYSLVFNKENPTVGLLNIGEEESKGPDFMRIVHKLFSSSPLNFIGNLEAKDIFSGRCDCVVSDGFVGNVALKVSEGLAEVIGKFLIDAIRKDLLGKIGLFLVRRSMRRFKRVIDYAEYGGAPLLGVNGVVIIGHGRSSSYAIKNAVKVAIQELQRDLIGRIKERLDEICKDSRVRQILTT